MRSKRLLGAAAILGAMAIGGVVGAMVGAPTVSMAQEDQDEPTTEERERLRLRSRCGVRLFVLDVAAETIGIDEAELREALREGQSIAEVAEAEGVEPQTVIDALVVDATARIDAAVAEGALDPERAAAMKERLVERVTDLVNGQLGPRRGIGFPGPRVP